MLWGALFYAAGTIVGTYLSRPAWGWAPAGLAFLAAAFYLRSKREGLAATLAHHGAVTFHLADRSVTPVAASQER
ncbi:MAG: hypothetical protein ABSF15_13895 [Candidatus Sulfotelmatobacter sp.]|jgi:hypothetical protein